MNSKATERKSPRGQTKAKEDREESAGKPQNDLLIAAIGASAGGIEAFTELVTNLPVDTGMAFVLVQHLDPKHHSILTELVSKKTPMTVK